jgi:PAS domain S-box-containing protein
MRRYQFCIEQQKEVAIELTEAESLDEAMRVALEYGIRISDGEWGRVCLLDKGGAASYLVQKGTPPEGIEFPPAEFFLETEPLDPRIRVFPFPHRDAPLGVLSIAGSLIHVLSLPQRSALETLARQLGITVQRLKTARALSESESRHRIISNLISDFAYSVELTEDGSEVIEWISGAYGRITGYSFEDIVGMPRGWQSILDPRDSTVSEYDPTEYHREPFQLEYRIVTKSGEVRWIHDFIHPIFDFHRGRVVRLLGACRDITARKNVELELLRQKERAENYFRIAGVMLIILDTRGRTVQINEKGLSILGYSREELLGRDWFDLCIPEGIRSEVRRGFEAFLRGDYGRSRAYYGRQGTNPVATKGGEVRTISWTNELIRDAEGTIIGTVSSGEDISEQLEAQNERERHKEQLIQADRLASLGVLVAGVGHEVNNPNQAILTAVQLLEEIWTDGRTLLEERYREKGDFVLGGESYGELLEVIPQYFEDIEKGARRIEHFIRDLRRYSRKEEYHVFEEVDLNDVISSVLVLLRSTVDSSVTELHLDLEENLPPVDGHFQRLEQVMVNLIQNACQALRERPGALTIRTRSEGDSGRVIGEVEDEGPGIDPETAARITEPFYTTKQDSGGMGLGLSISATIIRDHGGTLDFISREGEGTLARVSLPRLG